MTLSVVRAAVVALAAWFLLVGSAAGTTIVPSDGSLYADHAAKRVGDILTVTENGYGKRTSIEEYRLQGRGGSGIINIRTNKRNGLVIACMAVADEDEK